LLFNIIVSQSKTYFLQLIFSTKKRNNGKKELVKHSKIQSYHEQENSKTDYGMTKESQAK
jgi:hypothetical protein